MQRSQVKRDFTPQQIIQLCLALGSADYRWDGSPDSPIIFQTICHNPPQCGSYKLYYYPDSYRFHCYTECGDTFDVYELVIRALHCDFAQALAYVQNTLHLTFNKVGFFSTEDKPNDELDLLTRYCKLRNRGSRVTEPIQTYPPDLINLYTKAYPVEWQRDRITPDAMERFNIRFDVAENAIIIPHYDIDGQLVGVRSRTLDPYKVASGYKYMPTMLENNVDLRHTLRNHLYGLDKTKEAIQRTGKCMICESEKSVLQSWSYYGENSFTVAVCGSNISTIQRDLILNLGVHEVFLAFDREYRVPYSDESEAYAEKILRLSSLFTPYVTTYVIWDTGSLLGYKDSPTDQGKDVLETLMKQKFEVETEKE